MTTKQSLTQTTQSKQRKAGRFKLKLFSLMAASSLLFSGCSGTTLESIINFYESGGEFNLKSATANTETVVIARFDAKVSSADAADPSNFKIKHKSSGTVIAVKESGILGADAVEVDSLDLDVTKSNKRFVRLVTDAQTTGEEYVLTVDSGFESEAGSSINKRTTTFTGGNFAYIINVIASPEGSFTTGDTITLTVYYSDDIVVQTGSELPYIVMQDGTKAYYSGGSGTSELTFSYTVPSGETDTTIGFETTSSSIVLPDGNSFTSTTGGQVDLTLPGEIENGDNITIDTTPPGISSVSLSSDNSTNPGYVTVGDTITLTFTGNESLDTPTVSIFGHTSPDVTISGGPTTWTATYTVTSSDTVEGDVPFTINYTDTTGNDGTVVNTTTDGTSMQFFNSAPTVSYVTTAAQDGVTYGPGQTIPVQVVFERPVEISGSPQMTLELDGFTYPITYTSGSPTSVIEFNYTIQPGHLTTDLDNVSGGSINLSGGTITDLAGNTASLTLPSTGSGNTLAERNNITIDASSPAIVNITTTSNDGVYDIGDTIPLTLTFSTPIDLNSGTPQITLSSGAVLTLVPGDQTDGNNTTLQFNYTITGGEFTEELDITAFSLNGADITRVNYSNLSALESVPVPGYTGSLSYNNSIRVNGTLKLLNAVALSNTTVQLRFNTVVTAAEANTAGNYSIVDSTPATLAVSAAAQDGSDGSLVILTTAAQSSVSYTVTVSNLTADGSGTALSATASDREKTFNGVAPAVTVPDITSVSTGGSGTYNIGDQITITVQLDEAVDVTQNLGNPPYIELNNGGIAVLTGGDGTDTLTFTYTVQEGDSITDLNFAESATEVELPAGTTITGTDSGQDANLSLPPELTGGDNISIDGTVPVVSDVSIGISGGSNDGYVNDDETIQLTFTTSEDGTPDVTILGDDNVTFVPVDGTTNPDGTVTWTAILVVDDPTAFPEGEVPFTIDFTDDNGNTSTQVTTTDDGSTVNIYSTLPTITEVGTTAPDATYGLRQTVPITVKFNRPVTVDSTGGLPALTLDLDDSGTASNYNINYVSGSGTDTLVFNYTIQPGHNVTSLDQLLGSSLQGSGYSISDLSGNSGAGSSFALAGSPETLAENSNITVSSDQPAITRIYADGAADGAYKTGDVITIKVEYTEGLDIAGGTPQLTLNNGAVVNLDGGFSNGDNTLTFNYTVSAGDDISQLEVASLTAGGATLDATAPPNNDALLTVPAPGSLGSLSYNSNITVDTTLKLLSAVAVNNLTVNATFNKSLSSAPSFRIDQGSNTSALTVQSTSIGGASNATVTLTLNSGTPQIDGVVYTLVVTAGTAQDSSPLDSSSTNTQKDFTGSGLDAGAGDPSVPYIDSVSATPSTGNFNVGDNITIELNFSENVDLDASGGDLVIALNSGGYAYCSPTQTNTATINCTYTVGAGDNAGDLDYTGTSALTIPEGSSISGTTSGVEAAYELPGEWNSLSNTSSINVDGITPVLSAMVIDEANSCGGDSLCAAGDTLAIDIFFTEPVQIADGESITITLANGETITYTNSTGSTQTLSELQDVPYTIVAGDGAGDLVPTSVAIGGGDGALSDVSGNSLNTDIFPTADLLGGTDLTLDTDPPVVTAIVADADTTTCDNTGDNQCGPGEIVYFDITFSESVTVDAGDQVIINLNNGGQIIIDGPAGPGTTLQGEYSVTGSATGTVDVASISITNTPTDSAGNTVSTSTGSISSSTDLLGGTGIVLDLSDVATEAPTLTAPADSASVNASISVNFTLTEEASSGNVKLIFTNTGGTGDGNAPHTLTLSSAYETAASHSITINGADLSASTGVSSVDTSPSDSLVSGAIYTVTISYRDNKLPTPNTAATDEATGVTYDSTAPVIGITAPADSASVNGDQVITFNNSEPTSALASFDNFSTSVAAVSNTTTLADIPGWSSIGESTTFTLYVRDTDAAGNTGSDTAVSLTKDTTAPTVGISSPSSGDPVNGLTTISFTSSDNNNTEVSIDGTNWVSATSGTTDFGDITGFDGLGEGTFTLYFRDTDTAGNTATTNITLTKDTNPPTTQNSVFTASTTVQGGASVVISSSGAATNEVWFAPAGQTLPGDFSAGGTMTEAASGTATSILAPADEGTYYAYVIDAAGNVSSASTASLTVDNTPPTVNITAPADSATVKGSETISFTSTNGGTNPQVSVDNSNWDSATSGVTTLSSMAEFAGLGQGSFTLYLRDTDSVGNAATDTISLTKDTVAPAVHTVSIDQADINSGNVTAFSFTFGSAEVGADYDYTISSSGGGTNVTGNGTISTASDQITGINVSGLNDGTLTLSVTLTDPVGNTNSAATDTVSKDSGAPTGYSVSFDQTAVNSTNETAISFTMSGAEVTATYNYSIDDVSGNGPIAGSGTVSSAGQQVTGINLSTLADGETITLTFYLTDTGTNQGSNVTDTITKDTGLPSIAITSDGGSGAGNDFTTTSTPETISGTCSTDTSTVTATGGTVTNNCSGSGTWSASITLNGGVNAITVTGSDAAGNEVTDSVNITYNAPFEVIAARTLDCNVVNGQIDYLRVTLGDAVDDSTFDGFIENSEGLPTGKWNVSGFGDPSLVHGTAVPSRCLPELASAGAECSNATDDNRTDCEGNSATWRDKADDAVIYLKLTESGSFDTGVIPDLLGNNTTLVKLGTSTLLYDAAGTPGIWGSSDVTESDGAGPYAYLANAADAAGAAGIQATDTLTIRFSEAMNSTDLNSLDLDTLFDISGAATCAGSDCFGASSATATAWSTTTLSNDTLTVTFQDGTAALESSIDAGGAVYLKAKPSTSLTDTASNEAAETANVSSPPEIGGSFENLSYGPVITAASYQDTDGNGFIDHVKITFDKAVADSSFPGYGGDNTEGTVTSAWVVSGYNNVRLDTTDSIDGASGENNTVIWLAFDEGSNFDTGAKPDLYVSGNADLQDNTADKCYLNYVGASCPGSITSGGGTLSSSDVIETDGAKPIITLASGKLGVTPAASEPNLFVAFSENVWGNATQSACGSGGELAGSDFDYPVAGSGNVSAVSGTSSNDNCAAFDAFVELYTNAVFVTDDFISDEVSAVASSIYDAAGNDMNDSETQNVIQTTAPYLVVASSYSIDEDSSSSNTVGDRYFIRVFFSEPVSNATYTSGGEPYSEGDSEYHSALRPLNFTVSDITSGTPCALSLSSNPEAVYAVGGTNQVFDLEWVVSNASTEGMCGLSTTPDSMYEVVVANIKDQNEKEQMADPLVATVAGTDIPDTTSPALLMARSTGLYTVELTFSEPMKSGDVAGSAECRAAGSGWTANVNICSDSGGSTDDLDTGVTLEQIKYSLTPSLGLITSVASTANSSVFTVTHTTIQSGSFYSLTVYSDTNVSGVPEDASGNRNLSTSPKNQATFQGSGSIIDEFTDGPIFQDPFADQVSFSFAFSFSDRIYLGPNDTNSGAFRFEADGSNPITATFNVHGTCDSPTFGISTGSTACTDQGPEGELGMVGFNSGTVNVNATDYEILMVGPIKKSVTDAYFTQDVDGELDWTQCGYTAYVGANTESVQTTYAFGSNMYLGISTDHAGKTPILRKIALTDANTDDVLECAEASYPIGTMEKVNYIGNSATNDNPASGGAILGIESMFYWPTDGNFYVANNGGLVYSAGEPVDVGSNGSAEDDFTTVLYEGDGNWNGTSLVLSSLDKIRPGQKAIPTITEFNGHLYMIRNLSISHTNTTNETTNNGAELWKCTSTTDCSSAANWSMAASSANFSNGANILAFSLLQVNGDYLYLGADNTTNGVQIFRSNTTEIDSDNLSSDGHNDFDDIGTPGFSSPPPLDSAIGDFVYIYSSASLEKNGYNYIYVTVGDDTDYISALMQRD